MNKEPIGNNIDNIIAASDQANRVTLGQKAGRLIGGGVAFLTLGIGANAVLDGGYEATPAVPAAAAGADCDPNLGDVCTGDVIVDSQTGSTFETDVTFKDKGTTTVLETTTTRPAETTTTHANTTTTVSHTTTTIPRTTTTSSTSTTVPRTTTTTTFVPSTTTTERPNHTTTTIPRTTTTTSPEVTTTTRPNATTTTTPEVTTTTRPNATTTTTSITPNVSTSLPGVPPTEAPSTK